jgi:hypothetical protein
MNLSKIWAKILLVECSERSIGYETVRDIFRKTMHLFKQNVST